MCAKNKKTKSKENTQSMTRGGSRRSATQLVALPFVWDIVQRATMALPVFIRACTKGLTCL